MELSVIIIWFICGWVCYSIAESKKRSKLLWAVLGIMLGFIAVIIISILPAIPG